MKSKNRHKLYQKQKDVFYEIHLLLDSYRLFFSVFSAARVRSGAPSLLSSIFSDSSPRPVSARCLISLFDPVTRRFFSYHFIFRTLPQNQISSRTIWKKALAASIFRGLALR